MSSEGYIRGKKGIRWFEMARKGSNSSNSTLWAQFGHI